MSAQLILYIHNYTTTSLSRKSQTKTNHLIEEKHNVHKRIIVFNSHLISSIITSFSSITTYFRCTKCYFGLQEHAYKQQLSVGLQANWVTLRDKHTTEQSCGMYSRNICNKMFVTEFSFVLQLIPKHVSLLKKHQY